MEVIKCKKLMTVTNHVKNMQFGNSEAFADLATIMYHDGYITY